MAIEQPLQYVEITLNVLCASGGHRLQPTESPLMHRLDLILAF